MPTQTAPKNQSRSKATKKPNKEMAHEKLAEQPRIPEHEIKQNSGVSATMALQAAQKAWELRQAANAAGDPDAREEILAKAINKEIEAESFGKAAKYTRSGAFQGLAAGAGLGVQPGVTLGKLTGALVGGVVATVTGLLGGGIGSVYGAINGPFWDLGEMASHGVRGIIGDFPNWKSTPAQKRALEKMVMQTKDTQAPTREELEEMQKDAPDDMPQSWSQRTSELTSWRPSMPNMPSMPSMPKGAALGLGGLGASMRSWGGQDDDHNRQQTSKSPQQTQNQPRYAPQAQSQPPKQASKKISDQEPRKPREPPQPKTAPTPKEAPETEKSESTQNSRTKATGSSRAAPKANESAAKPKAAPTQGAAKPEGAKKNLSSSQPKPSSSTENRQSNPQSSARKKPRKLGQSSIDAQSLPSTASKKAPRKLESRKPGS